jgi:DNA-binding MarR family transcriptional regulator
MPRPRNETTNLHRTLEALNKKEQSSQELSQTLNVPLGTSRSTISMLRRMGFVEPVPALKRGVPFRLTEQGKKRLKELKQELQP